MPSNDRKNPLRKKRSPNGKANNVLAGVKCPEDGTSLTIRSGDDSTKWCECESGHKVTVVPKGTAATKG